MLIAAWLGGGLSLATTGMAAGKERPLPSGVQLDCDLAYVPNGDASQRLDLYLPSKQPDDLLPLIVHIHGGGWRGGSKSQCSVVDMVARGYAVASVEYRFSQKALFPAQIQDCQAAIRWLRANARTYGIDPDRVGVIGASAGGHLSSLVATTGGKKIFSCIGGNEEQSDRVQCVVNIYGPANFSTVMRQAEEDPNVRNVFAFNTPSDPYSSLIGTSLVDHARETDAVSPIHYVSAGDPPMLLLHGTHDALVPYAQSVEFEQALKSKGVDVLLQTLPGSGHGGPAFGSPEIRALIRQFFDRHLRHADVTIRLVPPAERAVDPPGPTPR